MINCPFELPIETSVTKQLMFSQLKKATFKRALQNPVFEESKKYSPQWSCLGNWYWYELPVLSGKKVIAVMNHTSKHCWFNLEGFTKTEVKK